MLVGFVIHLAITDGLAQSGIEVGRCLDKGVGFLLCSDGFDNLLLSAVGVHLNLEDLRQLFLGRVLHA